MAKRLTCGGSDCPVGSPFSSTNVNSSIMNMPSETNSPVSFVELMAAYCTTMLTLCRAGGC